MVRLKPGGGSFNLALRDKFQFLYGSIKAVAVVLPDSLFFDFNSSMVRLKRRIRVIRREHICISIPLWFD